MCVHTWSPEPEPDPEPDEQMPIRCHTCGVVVTRLPDNEHHYLHICLVCEAEKSSVEKCLAQRKNKAGRPGGYVASLLFSREKGALAEKESKFNACNAAQTVAANNNIREQPSRAAEPHSDALTL